MEYITKMDTPLFCVFVMAVSVALGYDTGAPSSACGSMTPGHRGLSPQSSAGPSTVSVLDSTYSPGGSVQVTISGVFKGFMVQARDSRGATVGQFFDTPSGTKTTRCSAADDTWTHTSQTSKTNLVARWYPPTNDVGPVKFRATVLQEFDTFWMGLESSVLTYKNPGVCHFGSSVFSISFALSICLLKEQLL